MEHALQDIPIALALGSNIGDRHAALRGVITALAPYVMVKAASPIYETPAFYVTDQPAFLNAAIVGTTKLSPMTLLWNLKRMETALGREPTFRYGPRRVDIDIIFYGDYIVAEPELSIPHPRMTEREFVLRPLADIASDWVHPQNSLTVAEMFARVAPSQSVCLGPL